MGIENYCAYNRKEQGFEVVAATGADDLATTIRTELVRRKLGIIVDESTEITQEQWQKLLNAADGG